MLPKILIISRDTELPKGFSKIMKDLFNTNIWQKQYEVFHYALNRHPAMQDKILDNNVTVFSENANTNRLEHLIEIIEPNIILCMSDPMVLQNITKFIATSSAYKIAYLFIDGIEIPFKWENILKHFDSIVSATHFGLEELQKSPWIEQKLHVINPPVDLTQYKPIEEIRRNKYREIVGLKENDFLITNISVNMLRKGLEYTLEFFEKISFDLKSKGKNAKLFLHTQLSEELLNAMKVFNIAAEDLLITSAFKTERDLIRFYQMSDLVINTSFAEGWGLPISEAMACGIPVLAPLHSGIKGAIGSETKSYKINSDRIDFFSYDPQPCFDYLYNSNCLVKVKKPNVSSLTRKANKIIGSDAKSLKIKNSIIQEGLLRVKELDSNIIANKWLEMFNEICQTQYPYTHTIKIPEATFIAG